MVVFSANAVLADHNSHFGEGTALDPQGIHDARIDSLDEPGSEAFQPLDLTGPLDLTAFARGGRPDTVDAVVDVSAGGSRSEAGATESRGDGGQSRGSEGRGGRN